MEQTYAAECATMESTKGTDEEESGYIPRVDTFDSMSVDEETADKGVDQSSDDTIDKSKTQNQPQHIVLSSFDVDVKNCPLFSNWEDTKCQVFFIAFFAIIGTLLRIHLVRFFGHDCEIKERNIVGFDDFVTPASSQICITSGGKFTRGGAIFSDLPANMLGSFLMGVLNPGIEGHPLGWLRADHPFQKHTSLHIGLKVGLCGCLTTFASWNTQMVVMIDGTASELGSQVGSALFGYMIGFMCAVSCYMLGRHSFEWMRIMHPLPHAVSIEPGITETTSGDLEAQTTMVISKPKSCSIVCLYIIPTLLVAGILGAYMRGDVSGNVFHRKVWLACVLAPFGAILRWRLCGLNGSRLRTTHFPGIPIGTLSANIIAVLLSVASEALNAHTSSTTVGSQKWIIPVLWAMGVGFAGSLSTVSSLVSEFFILETSRQIYIYGCLTTLLSMLLGLAVYSPIVRAD